MILIKRLTHYFLFFLVLPGLVTKKCAAICLSPLGSSVELIPVKQRTQIQIKQKLKYAAKGLNAGITLHP